MKLHIVSDGTAIGTEVRGDDGQLVEGVVSVEWYVTPTGVTAALTVRGLAADVRAPDGRTHTVRRATDSSIDSPSGRYPDPPPRSTRHAGWWVVGGAVLGIVAHRVALYFLA